MSYEVELRNEDGETVQVPKHQEGGTYVMGGTSNASLNVTYNYYPHFCAAINTCLGIRMLDGMLAKSAIPTLIKAVNQLGIEQSGNYWEGTPGNAGYALNIILGWCILHPNATIQVR